MPAALVQSVRGDGQQISTLTLPAPPTPGNKLVVMGGMRDAGGGYPAWTGSPFTNIRLEMTATEWPWDFLQYRDVIAGDPAAYSYNQPHFCSIVLAEFSGVAAGDPLATSTDGRDWWEGSTAYRCGTIAGVDDGLIAASITVGTDGVQTAVAIAGSTIISQGLSPVGNPHQIALYAVPSADGNTILGADGTIARNWRGIAAVWGPGSPAGAFGFSGEPGGGVWP